MMRHLLFIILIVMLMAGCYKPDDYRLNKGYTTEDVLNISVDQENILADGASTIKVTVTIPSNADPDKRGIHLETTNGIWKESGKSEITIIANAQGVSVTELQSSLSPGDARIRASIANIYQELVVTFQKAYPESINVDPGGFALKASFSESTTITAYLKRQLGLPSLGTSVIFSAIDDQGNAIGLFRSPKESDAKGAATVLFSVGNTIYRGVVTIAAAVTTPEGTIVGYASIIIIDNN